ncbi:hypothetical protein [Nocardia transvalensis]|uniref:hypothetical protein n=1 Tax=Nocardia transvalensis TaxID=37333 RepID=UPI003A5CDC55
MSEQNDGRKPFRRSGPGSGGSGAGRGGQGEGRGGFRRGGPDRPTGEGRGGSQRGSGRGSDRPHGDDRGGYGRGDSARGGSDRRFGEDRGGSGRGGFRRDDARGDAGRGGFRRDDARGESGRGGFRRDDARGDSGRGGFRRDDARGGFRRDDARHESGRRGFRGAEAGRGRDDAREFAGEAGEFEGRNASVEGADGVQERRRGGEGAQFSKNADRRAGRPDEPPLPDDVEAADLDSAVRRDLLSLDKNNAETVARHLVMAARLIDEDPEQALAHARAARQRAGRIAVVRETAGVTAYHAGEWAEALSELRTARRMSGGSGLLAVMADCERGLGRPERAIELGRSDEARQLRGDEATELRIVVAGARMDLGQYDQAVVTLQTPDLDPSRTGSAAARLFYAYAEALLAAGRADEALKWFLNAASADVDGETDAEERADELAGASNEDDEWPGAEDDE